MKPITFEPKSSTGDEDSTDNKSEDIMPGLQNCNRVDSSSEDDNDYNPGVNEAEHRKSSNNEEYHLDVSDNEQEYQHQSFLTNRNSSHIWSNDDDNNDKYDGDNDNNEDAKSRVAIRYPAAILRLQAGSRSPQVDMRIEEDSKEVPDKNDTVIVEDVKKNKEENDKPDNKYNKQGILESIQTIAILATGLL